MPRILNGENILGLRVAVPNEIVHGHMVELLPGNRAILYAVDHDDRYMRPYIGTVLTFEPDVPYTELLGDNVIVHMDENAKAVSIDVTKRRQSCQPTDA